MYSKKNTCEIPKSMRSHNIMKFLCEDYLLNEQLIDRNSVYESLEKYLYSQYSLLEGAQLLDLYAIGFIRACYLGGSHNLKQIAKFNSLDSNVDNAQDFILTESKLNHQSNQQKKPNYHINNLFMVAHDFLTDIKNSIINDVSNQSSTETTRSDIKFLASILFAIANESTQITIEFSNLNEL